MAAGDGWRQERAAAAGDREWAAAACDLADATETMLAHSSPLPHFATLHSAWARGWLCECQRSRSIRV